MKACPECGEANHPDNLRCGCGYELPRAAPHVEPPPVTVDQAKVPIEEIDTFLQRYRGHRPGFWIYLFVALGIPSSAIGVVVGALVTMPALMRDPSDALVSISGFVLSALELTGSIGLFLAKPWSKPVIIWSSVGSLIRSQILWGLIGRSYSTPQWAGSLIFAILVLRSLRARLFLGLSLTDEQKRTLFSTLISSNQECGILKRGDTMNTTQRAKEGLR